MNMNDVVLKQVSPKEAKEFAEKGLISAALMAAKLASKIQDDSVRLALGMICDNILTCVEAQSTNQIACLPDGATKEEKMQILKEQAYLSILECTLADLGLL